GSADRLRRCPRAGQRRLFRRRDRRGKNSPGGTHRAAVDRSICAGRKCDHPGNRPDSGARLRRLTKMTRSTKNHGTVLITGASAGIGRELALEFGARAEMLVLVARRLDRLEALKAELAGRYPRLKVVVLAADLSDESDIETLLGRVAGEAGTVDVL